MRARHEKFRRNKDQHKIHGHHHVYTCEKQTLLKRKGRIQKKKNSHSIRMVPQETPSHNKEEERRKEIKRKLYWVSGDSLEKGGGRVKRNVFIENVVTRKG